MEGLFVETLLEMRIVHATGSVHMLHLRSVRMYGCLLIPGRTAKDTSEQDGMCGGIIKSIIDNDCCDQFLMGGTKIIPIAKRH
jgi:hypothetical protein